MKPILTPRISLVIALAAGLSGSMADTIKLKSGKTLEGTITSETADSYEIEVEETKGIKDFVKVKKTDAVSVTKTPPDEKEAEALLGKLKPTADAMTASDYEKKIKGDIQPWLDKNKTSKKRKDIEELLKLYTDELAKVKAGDIKLRGVWISADETKWNAYNITARKLRLKFEALIKAKKYPEAYAVFAEMELNGAAGVDFPPVVEAMVKALPALESSISQAIVNQPIIAGERQTLLKQQTPEKKKEMDEVIKKELADYRVKTALEKKNKVRVPSFDPYDLKTIQASLDAVKKESAALTAIDTQAMTLANKRFEQGLREMNEKAFLSAKTNFEAAVKFHSKNPLIKKHLDDAVKAIDAAKNKKPGAK
jgi:hypothetical protein